MTIKTRYQWGEIAAIREEQKPLLPLHHLGPGMVGQCTVECSISCPWCYELSVPTFDFCSAVDLPSHPSCIVTKKDSTKSCKGAHEVGLGFEVSCDLDWTATRSRTLTVTGASIRDVSAVPTIAPPAIVTDLSGFRDCNSVNSQNTRDSLKCSKWHEELSS